MADISPSQPFWRPALAGAAAVLVGIGLARFAYVPLFPAMVGAGWVDGGGAGLLGAANLAGYLAGVMGGRGLARQVGVPRTLDLSMALALVAFAACAFPGGLWWFVLWRGLSGVAGGLLMALVAPAVQSSVAPSLRPMAGGVVMSGAGGGVAVVGLLVPALLLGGVSFTWAGLAVAAGVLWLVARPNWPNPPPLAPAEAAQALPRALRLLLAYGLSGAGMVAPMVYLADLAVRGRGLPIEAGSFVWVSFGLGAVAGTLLGGRVGGLIGGRRAMPIWLLVQVLALAAAMLPWWPALLLAGPLGGFAGIGMTAVTLVAAREVAGPKAGQLWLRATVGYALAQAVTAFALAALFAATGESHTAVFGAGLALSLAALVVALARR